MIRDIVKNLWYSYISRKMWETESTDCFGSKIGYSFCGSPEFRFRVMPLFLLSWVVLGIIGCGLAGASRLFFAVAILIIPNGICHVVDYLIEKGKPAALYYAKARLGNVRKKQSEEYNIKKDIKKCCYPLTQRVRDIYIHNIWFCFIKDGLDNGEDFLAVGSVADGESVLKGTGKVGERESIQKNVVTLVEKCGTEQVCKNTGRENDNFSGTFGRIETPALEGAFTADKEGLGNNDCYTCYFKNGNCRLIFLAKCYFSGWFVKDSKSDSVSKFVDCGCQRDRKKCAQQKICDILDILQDNHLWGEYNRFDKVLLFLTGLLWVPMALINGGFRAAYPYGNESRLRSFFEEVYFFSFVSGVCALITGLFAL